MADQRRETRHAGPGPSTTPHGGSPVVRAAGDRISAPAGPHARDPSSRHRPGQDGNALVLMPIGVLVVLLLAGLAVDTALLYRAQAELDSVAAALANDAAEAIDTGSLFDADADVRVAPGELDRLEVLHASVSGVPGTACEADVVNGPEPVVTATCEGDAEAIFRTVAGLDNGVHIETTESADLRTNWRL